MDVVLLPEKNFSSFYERKLERDRDEDEKRDEEERDKTRGVDRCVSLSLDSLTR